MDENSFILKYFIRENQTNIDSKKLNEFDIGMNTRLTY